MKRALVLPAVALCLVFGGASSAWADVAPPNSTCNSLQPGDACKTDDGKAGLCTATTWAGGTVTLCVETSGTTTTTTGTGGGTASGSTETTGCATAPGAAEGAFWLAALFVLPLLRRGRRR